MKAPPDVMFVAELGVMFDVMFVAELSVLFVGRLASELQRSVSQQVSLVQVVPVGKHNFVTVVVSNTLLVDVPHWLHTDTFAVESTPSTTKPT